MKKYIDKLGDSLLGGKLGMLKLLIVIIISTVLLFLHASTYNNIYLYLQAIPAVFLLGLVIVVGYGIIDVWIIRPIKWLINKIKK